MKTVSPAKDFELAPSQTWLVAISVIDVAPQVRTRFDQQGLAELTESIKANGILQPLLLRPGKKAGRYELVAGERRLRAAKAAGLTHVPAITGQTDDQAKLRMQIAENLDREDLNLEEIAKVVRALYDAEGDIGKVAAIVKRSKPWVSKHLAVTLRWNYRAQRLLETGACEDLELLGAYSQLCEIALYTYPQFLSCDEIEKLGNQVRNGKIDRARMRALVGEAKQRLKDREAAARAKEKARKPGTAAATPKPKRFNPKTAIRELFSTAWCFDPADAEPDEKSPDIAATLFDDTQRAKMVEILTKAHSDGLAAAARAGDPYKAVLGKFYARSYAEGHEHAAWLAGAFARPLDVSALLKDVIESSRASVARWDDDGDDDGDDDDAADK